METRRGAREQPGQPPKLAAVVDHPTRQRRPRYKTLKATLGRPERDTLLVLRRKLAARIDSDDQPGHALALLVRQFRDVDGQIRAIDVRALKRPRPMRPMMTATMTARSTCQRFNTEWGTGGPNLSSRSRFAVLTERLIGRSRRFRLRNVWGRIRVGPVHTRRHCSSRSTNAFGIRCSQTPSKTCSSW